MSTPRQFSIQFTGTADKIPIFEPGQTVNGDVFVEWEESTNVRAIRLHATGESSVRWSEGSGEHKKTYSNSEIYFDFNTDLFGKAESDRSKGSLEIAGGEHNFPFSFTIPINIPPTYTGALGQICYKCSAKIELGQKVDPKKEASFIVKANEFLDLEHVPDAKLPVEAAGYLQLCCLFCKTDPIKCKIKSPQMGWLPGQWLTVEIDVDNRSSRRIRLVEAQLKMVDTFHAIGKSSDHASTIVSNALREGLADKRKSAHHNVSLYIPDNTKPSGHLSSCKIIESKYVIQVTVSPSGLTWSQLTARAPIIIGSDVPEQTIQMASSMVSKPSREQNGSVVPDSPPPSYQPEPPLSEQNNRPKSSGKKHRVSTEQLQSHPHQPMTEEEPSVAQVEQDKPDYNEQSPVQQTKSQESLLASSDSHENQINAKESNSRESSPSQNSHPKPDEAIDCNPYVPTSSEPQDHEEL